MVGGAGPWAGANPLAARIRPCYDEPATPVTTKHPLITIWDTSAGRARGGRVAGAVHAALLAGTLATAASAQVITESTPTGATPPTAPVRRTYHHIHQRRPTTLSRGNTAVGSTSAAPRLLWRTLLHRSDGTPAPAGNAVVATAGSGVYALDADGHTLSMTEIGPTQDTPAVDDNRIYVGTDRGAFYGLDRRTSKVLYKFTGAGDSVLTSPAMGGGRVYFESSDNYVYGLAALNGGQIWKFFRPDGSLGYSSPVFVDNALYVCGDSALYRLDPATGTQVWHTPVGGKSLSTPSVDANRIIVGSDGAGLTALAPSDGHPLWSYAGRGEHEWFGAPTTADGAVYVGSHGRYLYAVDAATGKPKWAAALPGPSGAAPAVDAVRHVVYVTSTTATDAPTLSAFDTRTGVKQWEYKAGSVTGGAVVSGDRLYLISTTGYFYCFALR